MGMHTTYCLVVAALLSLLHSTTGFSGGAPDSTCSTLTPKHHTDPQSSVAPFEVVPGKLSVAPGAKITLMLKSPVGVQFKGFLIQARNGEGSDSALGHFTVLPNGTKTFSCAGGNVVSVFNN